MNSIKTLKIHSVIASKNNKNTDGVEHYIIPYYQRGYRWEDRHVKYLLEDIDNFINNGDGFYCLQPIVVAPVKGKDNTWEVIDGQQRLISLYIIFKYLDKPKYYIEFEKRIKSTEFLKQLSFDKHDHDKPDHHYMSQAYNIVSEWFEEKLQTNIAYKDKFYTATTDKVKVIWYQLEELKDDKKIEVFNRLNIGKIELTDSELVRALLLSKIKYGLSEHESVMRQAEVSNEWNRIEHELRDNELWLFLNNSINEKLSSRIEFIFNLMAGRESKEYSTFLWFEKTIKNANSNNRIKEEEEEEENTQYINEQQLIIEKERAIELWDTVKIIFGIFKSWYNNHINYHYVGYLLASDLKINIILDKSKELKKNKFREWLEAKIIENVAHINLSNIKYDENPADVKRILLLLNVITMKNLSDSPLHRFPFNLYKEVNNNGGWSLEHIHAQNSEDITDPKAIKKWLEATKTTIENIKAIDKTNNDFNFNEEILIEQNKNNNSILIKPYIDKINSLLESSKIDIDNFNNFKSELIELFDSKSIHDIDNLALLGKKDNSALNNAIFPTKRNKIIEMEKNGKFIPPCTRNVFLKFYSTADTQPYYWSTDDKIRYFNEIQNVLSPFINK